MAEQLGSGFEEMLREEMQGDATTERKPPSQVIVIKQADSEDEFVVTRIKKGA